MDTIQLQPRLAERADRTDTLQHQHLEHQRHVVRLAPGVALALFFMDQLAPMLLISKGANWLSGEAAITDVAFLLKQII